ncbi:MAG: HAD hydrolase-like protein [Methyloprofundus sp.]|nr:HAD hydrolase-like protein [Methyloprofundus sp.]
MVGDFISDIQAGKRMNFKTTLVPLGKYTPNELDDDYNIDKIDQLFSLFYQSP